MKEDIEKHNKIETLIKDSAKRSLTAYEIFKLTKEIAKGSESDKGQDSPPCSSNCKEPREMKEY